MADAWFNVAPWSPSYPDRIAALAPEAVVVLVDAFTAVGGSQYVDSPGIGNYHTYLCDEVVPFVDANFPTLPEARHRGIQGKSSGGYGSMITPLLRPDLFGGLATHAGDALFEVCYARDFAPAARALREALRRLVRCVLGGLPLRPPGACLTARRAAREHLCDVRRVLRARRTAPSTCRSTSRPASGSRRSGSAGSRWTRCVLARQPEHAETLRNMRAIWIDSGRSDEYHLDLGATAFHREVVAAGTPEDHVHFELFPGTHRGLDLALPALARVPRRQSPLHHLVGRLVEAELAIERVHVRRVQEPLAGRANGPFSIISRTSSSPSPRPRYSSST